MNDELNERRRSDDADGSAPHGRTSNHLTGPDGHLDAAVLAGYVDDPAALTLDEQSTVQAHLGTCAACRETLAEMRAVVAALESLPEVQPRRSFALTPAMVGQHAHLRPVPAVVREPRTSTAPIDMRRTTAWHERQMRAVRWATVAAALLFVLVLSADIMSNRVFVSTDDDPVVMSNPGSDPASMTAPETSQAPAAAEAATAEDAAGTTSEMRSMSDEPEAEPTPAAAQAEEDSQQVSGEIEDPQKREQESLQFQDGSADDSATLATDEDPRSMSTPEHYWRLAQVGLALLIVWLLAAMIALPRIRSGRNRQ